ncbi:MAG: MFS transporter [Gammaproteobacteria bacterium]|nr:MFS transporter [Gammaproteobacteria bacterium]
MNEMTGGPHSLGPIKLARGIRPANALFFVMSALLGVCLTTYISTIQPYVLAVNLGLPNDQQGQVSGLALFAGEIVLLVSSAFIGAFSDRIGRRGVFLGGALLLALGYVLFAYVDTVVALVAVRMFISVGIAVVNVMVGVLMVDYPAEESRGKLVALAGIAIGIGNMLIGIIFLRLPEIYSADGTDALTAGQLTMFTMAGLCLLLALVVRAGLKGGRPEKAQKNEPFRQRVGMGIRAGRENKRVLLAYFCAFVARGDLVVIGTFYTLWLIQAGIQSGMSPEVAATKAGIRFAMVMFAALLWAPVMGWLNDHMDRAHAMGLAMGLAAVGYIGIAFVPDPFGVWMYPAMVVLGIGQISVVLASQTLIGQESPPSYRGSVVGMFSMFGAAGILFISSVGGWAFDAVSPLAPFILIGIVNSLLCFFSIGVARATQPRKDYA